MRETDFGVDPTSLIVDVVRGAEQALLTLEVKGDPRRFDTIAFADDSDWSWANYPPFLYLREMPLTPRADGTLVGTQSGFGTFDAGLYMMEHNAIEDLSVVVTPDGGVETSGRVDLLGEPVGLRLEIGKP